jgi:hypothetical protein
MNFAIKSSIIKASITAANPIKPVTYTIIILKTPGTTANRAPAAAAVYHGVRSLNVRISIDMRYATRSWNLGARKARSI